MYDGVSAFILEAGEDLPVPANSEDPGSDDLTFVWDWDGALNGETPDEQTSLNDALVDPDPALSPSIHPRSVSLEATHAYSDACRYDLDVTVTDDDLGSNYLSLVFSEGKDADSRADATLVLQNPAKSPADVIFDQHALGAWLNFANGSVKLDTPVDSVGGPAPDSTFGAVMFTAETIRMNPASTSAQIKAQKDIVERTATQSAP